MSDMTLEEKCREFLKGCSNTTRGEPGDCPECTNTFLRAVAEEYLPGYGTEPEQPHRFLAIAENGTPIASGAEPKAVQDRAQDYAEAHKGQYVHLYQHAMSLRCSDGD